MISDAFLQKMLDAMPHQQAGESDADYLKRYTDYYDQFAFTTMPARQNAPTVKTTTVHTNKAA